MTWYKIVNVVRNCYIKCIKPINHIRLEANYIFN
nr:MAG TPA: hypothetical protein [Caudoviricetes sp.]